MALEALGILGPDLLPLIGLSLSFEFDFFVIVYPPLVKLPRASRLGGGRRSVALQDLDIAVPGEVQTIMAKNQVDRDPVLFAVSPHCCPLFDAVQTKKAR